MTDRIGRAEYEIEADYKGFIRDLKRAEKGADASSQKIEGRFKGVSRSFKGMGGALGKVALGATVAGAGFLLLLKNALSAAEGIGDMAKRANTTAEQLQELRFAVTQNGASIRDADDALVRLNRRLSLFVTTGGGPGALAFEELGIQAKDAEGNIRNSSDVFDEIATKIAAMEDASKAAALASSAFGEDAGPRLVPLLKQGEEGMRAAREEARRLGLVLDNDTVDAAAEASARLRSLGQIIQTGLTNALVTAAPLITDLAERMFRALPTIIAWIDRIGQAIGLLDAPLAQQLVEQQDVLRTAQSRLRREQERRPRTEASREQNQTRIARFSQQEREAAEAIEAVRSQIDERRARREALLSQFSSGGAMPPSPSGGRSGGGSGGGGSSAMSEDARAADQASQAFGRMIDQLADLRQQRQREIEVSRMTELGAARVTAAYEQEEAAAKALELAIRSGGAVSDQDLARTIALTEQIERLAVAKAEAAAQSRLKEEAEQEESDRLRTLTGDARTLTSALFDAATASTSWQDALLKIVTAILELESVQHILADTISLLAGTGGKSGGGFLSSLIGGLFGVASGGKAGGSIIKGFAGGGRPPVGQFSIVGENGPELRYFGRASTILSADKTSAALGGGGGVYAPLNVTVHGVSEADIMAKMEPRLEAHRQTIIRDVSETSTYNPEYIDQ